VTFEEVKVSREFKRVTVTVLNADGRRVQVSPEQVDLTVHGPQRVLHNYRIPEGAVFVDAAGLPPGRHRLSVRADLPAALEVTRRQPEAVVLEVAAGRGS
jgi:hypothetical protein